MLVETRNCEKVARGSRWPVVQTTDEFCIVENPRPSDRYTLVTQAKAVATEDAMLDEVRLRPEGPVPVVAPPDALAALSNGYVWAGPYEPGHAQLRVVTGRAGLVLVRQSALPGWDVRVDGTEVTPYPAAGVFFAVPVRAGIHQVVLQYRTPGFRTGLALSVGWMLLVGMAAGLQRLLGRREPDVVAVTSPFTARAGS
jgi:hypothetical protein